MKKPTLFLAAGLLLAALTAPASAAGRVYLDGEAIQGDLSAQVVEQTTYVSLRTVTEALRPDASVSWEGRAVVKADGLAVSAQPGAPYITANGRAFFIPNGVRLENGRTLVPIRTLAKAMGAEVEWDAATGDIHLHRGSGAVQPASLYYEEDAVYWLSRIISAESRGEPLLGKIAVGNVVMNRVGDEAFPDTIYGVIFDERWGGQFEPVRNGTVFDAPTEESVLAAKLCLDGADVAGESLYFLAPALTDNHWMMENRPFVMTIGSHWFYR